MVWEDIYNRKILVYFKNKSIFKWLILIMKRWLKFRFIKLKYKEYVKLLLLKILMKMIFF